MFLEHVPDRDEQQRSAFFLRVVHRPAQIETEGAKRRPVPEAASEGAPEAEKAKVFPLGKDLAEVVENGAGEILEDGGQREFHFQVDQEHRFSSDGHSRLRVLGTELVESFSPEGVAPSGENT